MVIIVPTILQYNCMTEEDQERVISNLKISQMDTLYETYPEREVSRGIKKAKKLLQWIIKYETNPTIRELAEYQMEI